MQLPPILQGESITRLLQGAFVGFAATAIIGFTWGGWTLGKTARDMADKSAATAVVAALAPICVDKFQHDVDAKTNLTELMKISSWQQGPSSRRVAGQHCQALTPVLRRWLKLVPTCSPV